MADSIFFNDVALETYGLRLVKPARWRDMAEFEYDEIKLAGEGGVFLDEANPQVNPRRMTLDLTFARGTTISSRLTLLRTFYKTLRQGGGVIRPAAFDVRLVDDSTRFVPAVLRRAPFEVPTGPDLAEPGHTASVQVELVSQCPYYFATSVTNVSIPNTGAAQAITLGSAEHGGTLLLPGAATNPVTVRLRKSGVEIGLIVLSTTWTGAQSVTIDFDNWTITRNDGTPMEPFMGATNALWRFDPRDTPLTLEMTGAQDGTYSYRVADLL